MGEGAAGRMARWRLPRVAAPAALVSATVLAAALYVRFGDDHSDIGGYHRDAVAFFASGGARHLPPEYPPLSLIPFSITLLPGPDFGVAFVAAMAVLFLAACAVVARLATRRVAAAFAIYLLLAGPWTLFGRFDLVVSLVVLGAVVAAGSRRWNLAYALLAAGVLLKLYPLFLTPLFLIAQWKELPAAPASGRQMLRAELGPTVFGLVVIAGAAAAAAVDPSGWLNPVTYALQRPVQVESVPATALWIVSGFVPGRLVYSFNSVNVIAPGSAAVTAIALAALAAGLVAIVAAQASGRLTLRRACLGALLVVVVTSRVLSPQYLVWILPLVALELGIQPIWIGICTLTFIAYPILFSLTGLDGAGASAFDPVLLATLAVRNALLVLAAWRILWQPAPSRSPDLSPA